MAERAQQEGAEIVLTGFGRTRRMTERAAARLPEPPDVLELDVNNPDDFAALRGELEPRWGGIDGALHAIAFAPGRRARRQLHERPPESAELAFRTSAYSFKALAEAVAPADGRRRHPRGHRLRRHGGLAGLRLDGRGQGGAESVSRYLARDLGGQGVRVNLVSAGPVETPAARGIPGFDNSPLWESRRRWAGTRAIRRRSRTPCCSCSPTWSRGVTGEILHVDGGFHAMGAPSDRCAGADPPARVPDADAPAVLLAIDVGNTQTHVGMFREDELVEHWRFATARFATADELATVLAGLLDLRELPLGDVRPRSSPRSCPRSRTSSSR